MQALDADIVQWIEAGDPQMRAEINALLRETRDKWSLPAEADAMADKETARIYLERLRWPLGRVRCPYCGGGSLFLAFSATYACRGECASTKTWSVRTQTAFEASNLPLNKWLQCLRFYLDCDPRTFGPSRFSTAGLVSLKTAYSIIEKIEDRCGDFLGSRSPLWVAATQMLAPADEAEDEAAA